MMKRLAGSNLVACLFVFLAGCAQQAENNSESEQQAILASAKIVYFAIPG